MKKERLTVGAVAFNVANCLVFALFTFICVFPFYYIFINTISANNLASTGKILFLPRGIHFQNYATVFKIRGLARAAYISAARTMLGTTFTLLGSSFLGYALSRREMWGRKLWYRLVVVTLYFNAGLIPWFITMKLLGLLDSFWAYVLPSIVGPFYLILYKTYIEQIPASLEESAQTSQLEMLAGQMDELDAEIVLSAPPGPLGPELDGMERAVEDFWPDDPWADLPEG